MKTIYYSIDAKRLTMCGRAEGRRASGGAETVCYAFVSPRRQARREQPGKILDFEAYRQEAERPETEEPVRREVQETKPRGLRPWLLLDLCASAAVVAVVAAVLVRFFTL